MMQAPTRGGTRKRGGGGGVATWRACSIAGAEVDDGVEDDDGEAEWAVGAKDVEEDLPGAMRRRSGLEVGLVGIDGEHGSIGEGLRVGAGAGPDGGAGEAVVGAKVGTARMEREE